jgi:hypothetical protein
MAYRVDWSPRAVEDLGAIAQYIAADSEAYAASVVKQFSQPQVISRAFHFQVGLFQSLLMRAFVSGSSTAIE